MTFRSSCLPCFVESQARGDGSESDWEASEHSQQAAEEPPGIFATVGLMGFGGQCFSLAPG